MGSPGVVPTNAFGHLEPRGALGLATQITSRHSPSFLTAAWFDELFWDGRAEGKFRDPLSGQVVIQSGAALETQSLGPIVSDVEMADRGRGWTRSCSASSRSGPWPSRPAAGRRPRPRALDVTKLFERAFGMANTLVRIAFALATYQRSLVPNATPFDDFMRGDQGAMTAQQIRGMNLFDSTAVCAVCHTPPLFANGGYHSIVAEQRGPGRYWHRRPQDLDARRQPAERGLRALLHIGTNTPRVARIAAIYTGGGGRQPRSRRGRHHQPRIDDLTAYRGHRPAPS